MTPTLKIDKRYPNVGRIAVRSGTHNADVYQEILVALRWLSDRGDTDTLRLVQQGELHPLEVRAAFMAGDLRRLPQAGDLKKLKPAVERWLKYADLAETTRRQYEWHLGQLIGKVDPRVTDLPRLLARFREKCRKAGHHRTFNHARAAVLSFVNKTNKLGRQSPIWVECAAVRVLPVARSEKPYLPVQKCRAVAQALGRNGGMWWSMCVTGMNPKEYFEDGFEVGEDRIRVFGQKRIGRMRDIPLVYAPVEPWLGREGFKTAMQKVETGLTPKNGRDAYTQWLRAAGVPPERVDMYLGHGKRTMLDVYQRYEAVAEILQADAELAREYIGEPYRQLQVMG